MEIRPRSSGSAVWFGAVGALAFTLLTWYPALTTTSAADTEVLGDMSQEPEEEEKNDLPRGQEDEDIQLAQASGASKGNVNQFNRLMKNPMTELNSRPAEDGIHDPESPGTHALQWPSESFSVMPRTTDGNKVDWVKALEQGLISPRYELEDPDAESFTMDLTIIREVKGSMPNVVFPHQQHTEWLDCSNCHDEIFVPQKGANQISMAGILLGEKCGVCHGRVAFPVTDCRRCHAQPKTKEELQEIARQKG